MAVSIYCSALYTTDTSQMAAYTLNELTDMHLLHGETLGNSRAARSLYAEKFSMRRLPSHVLFQRIDARMRETGHMGPTRRGAGRSRSVRHVAFEDRVLQLFRETLAPVRNPWGGDSTLVMSMCGTGLHPYHMQRVQHLTADDFPRHQFVETEHEMVTSSSETFLRKGAVLHGYSHVSPHTEDACP